MPRRKQLSTVIETIASVVQTEESEALEKTLIEDYKELNKKCDHVITKIKSRKKKVSINSEGK